MFLLGSLSGPAQNTTPLTDSLLQRIETLEKEVAQHEQVLSIDGLVERKVSQYYDKELLTRILIFVSGIVAIFGGYAVIYRRAMTETKKRIDQKVSETLETRIALVKSMIDWEKITQNLIKDTRILILFMPDHENDGVSALQPFLEKLKFPSVASKPLRIGSKPKLEDLNTYGPPNINWSTYDIVIIDDEQSGIGLCPKMDNGNRGRPNMTWVQRIIQYIDKQVAIFYFGPGIVEIKDKRRKENLSFAKAKSQIYGNLVNLISMQARMNRKIS